MQRLDPKAIAIATLLSLALDTVGGFVLVGLLNGGTLNASMGEQEMAEALRAITQSDSFLMASLVYGSLTSVLGGYLAARLARSHPYFNALGVGVAGIVLGLLLGGGEAPAWYTALGLVSTPLLAVLGGHLWQRSRPSGNK